MGEFGEITILNQHSDRQTKLKVFKKDTITTGGTRPIDIVEANVVHGTQERSAGKYVIKHEYYSGEIEEKMERYDACKKAGLPVPSTFRKGVTTKKENVLVITYLKDKNGEVWSLNDKKERLFPVCQTLKEAMIKEVYGIADKAAQENIGLTAYAYMVVVDSLGQASFIIGDFGTTEVKPNENNDIANKNQKAAEMFLKRAGLIKTDKPAQPVKISVSL